METARVEKMDKAERVPVEDRLAAQEALIERQSRHLVQSRQFASMWNKLDEAYRREMRALIGEDKVKKALPTHRGLLEKIAKTPTLFDTSSDGQKKEEAYRKQIIEQRHDLYRSLGFDHEKAIELRQVYLKEANSVLEQYLDIGKDPEYVTRSSDQLPATENPWTHFVAPYSDEWGTSNSGDTRGYTSASHSEDRTAGEINCWSYSRLVGADDSDSGWTKAMSEVWVWLRMPAAGLVEAWAYLQDIDTNLDGRLRDESGCSDGSVRQLTRAYLWTSGGTERYQTIRDYSVSSDGSNRSWNIPLSSPGSFLYPHLFSSESYAAGQWVLAAIGVQDDSSFRVNDMSVDPSRLTSRYFVKDIYLRSTGAP